MAVNRKKDTSCNKNKSKLKGYPSESLSMHTLFLLLPFTRHDDNEAVRSYVWFCCLVCSMVVRLNGQRGQQADRLNVLAVWFNGWVPSNNIVAAFSNMVLHNFNFRCTYFFFILFSFFPCVHRFYCFMLVTCLPCNVFQ